jgi:hypothetical protein
LLCRTSRSKPASCNASLLPTNTVIADTLGSVVYTYMLSMAGPGGQPHPSLGSTQRQLH